MQMLLLLSILSSIDMASAQRAFAELDAMCKADHGALWGREICGPTVFVDPRTREAVASADGRVTATRIPESIGIANTAVAWEGRQWTMVVWPLPDDALARRALLAHETFHRVQKELGFPSTGPSNAHLDSADARYWLRLEWRALARALETGDRTAVADALAFRAQRRALTKSAAEDERLLELHEGLAEHTGYALAEPRLTERSGAIAKKLRAAEHGESFVRSFAYASGPAWGALIEKRDRRWTRRAKATDDLGELARRAWKVEVLAKPADRYDAGVVRAEEDERDAKKRELRARLRARYVDGAVLTLPLRKMQMVMDPNGLQPLEDVGTVYTPLEISDEWGKIVAPGGALISSDFTHLVVPASGEGWTLTLSEGWTRTPGARAGDFSLTKSQR